MQTFWHHLENCSSCIKPSDETLNNFREFISHYAYNRAGTTYRLAHYLIPLDRNDINTDNFMEYLLNSNKPFTHNISLFLKRFEEAIPDFRFSTEGWYNNFKELASRINEYLINHGISDELDIKEELVHMLDSADEFKCLENIIALVEGNVETCSSLSFSEFTCDNIDEIIEFFDMNLNELSSDINKQRDIKKEFTDFFIKLRETKEILLTKEQVERLQKLVSKFVEHFAVSSLPYRRALLNVLGEKP